MRKAERWRGGAGSPGLPSLQQLRTELGYLESEKYLCVSSYIHRKPDFFQEYNLPGLHVAGQTVF